MWSAIIGQKAGTSKCVVGGSVVSGADWVFQPTGEKRISAAQGQEVRKMSELKDWG